MGDYHTKRTGHGPLGYQSVCKVGVCDDWRYVRRAEAEQLGKVDAGGGAHFPTVLALPSTLYRFPWPHEDGHAGDVAHINGRDMFVTHAWSLPPDVWADIFGADGLEHRAMCVPVKAEGMGSGANVFFPCPLSPEFTLRTSQGGFSPTFNVYGERYVVSVPYTVFRCGFCGAPFALPPDELDALWHALKSGPPTPPQFQSTHDWTVAVWDRFQPKREA